MHYRGIKKIVSIVTIIIFICSNTLYGATGSRSFFKNKKVDYEKLSTQSEERLDKKRAIFQNGDDKEAKRQKETQRVLSSHLKDLSQIHIPSELGRVIEVYEAPPDESRTTPRLRSGQANGPLTPRQAQGRIPSLSKDSTALRADERRLIVHIQDLHTNPEAQLNLANILEILLKDYNLGLVCSEGADGEVDTSSVSSFPDYEVREKTARLFINSGELTGEEYLSITKYPDLPIWGIEDRDIYFKNIIDFNKIMKFSPQSQVFISQAKNTLELLKPKIYSKEMLNLDQKETDYENQKIETDEYLKYLISYIQKFSIPTKDYKNITLLSDAIKQESRIDQVKIMQESQNLLLNLQASLSGKNLRSEIDALMIKAQLFKEQKISPFSFYSYLKDLALKHIPDKVEKYSELNNFIDYLTKINSLDSTKLFVEMEGLTYEVKTNLSKTEEQKTLTEALRNIKFLEGFFNLKVSNEELDYYLNNKDSHKAAFFEAFLKPAIKEYNISSFVDFNPELIDSHLKELEDFYKTVKKRDLAMVENSLSEIEKRDVNVAALISGGFHTKGITRLLRGKGYSYIVVSPYSSTDIDEENYHFLLSGQRKPITELLEELDLGEVVKRLSSSLRVPMVFDTDMVAQFNAKVAPVLARELGLPLQNLQLAQIVERIAVPLGVERGADAWEKCAVGLEIKARRGEGIVVVKCNPEDGEPEYIKLTRDSAEKVGENEFRGNTVVAIGPETGAMTVAKGPDAQPLGEDTRTLGPYIGAGDTSIHIALSTAEQMIASERFEEVRALLIELEVDLREAFKREDIVPLMEKYNARFSPDSQVDLFISDIPAAIKETLMLCMRVYAAQFNIESQDVVGLYGSIHGESDIVEGFRLSIERLGSQNTKALLKDDILTNEDRALIFKYLVFGKGNVFSFWDELSNEQKRRLISQLSIIDLEEVERLYKDYILDRKPGAEVVVAEETLDVPDVSDLTQGDTEENLRAGRVGRDAFKRGEVALLELAGGSGSRLGYEHPKIMFHASHVMNKSLARMRAEKIRALSEEYGRPVPWIIMTSDVTDEETRRFFNDHLEDGKYFNEVPVEWVKFVRQRVMPQVIDTGEFILSRTKDSIVVGGFGHGDARDYVLKQEDVLTWLRSFGIKYVAMLNVDNAFLLSERSIGHHVIQTQDARPGIERMSMLVVEKLRPEEKVGMAVLLDGENALIEYNQVPHDLSYLIYVYALNHERVVFLKEDDTYRMLEIEDLKENYGNNFTDPDWVAEHLVAIDDLPDGIQFSLLGRDYTKEILTQWAKLWLRLGNINTLIWTLDSFTDEEHPLGELPVVVAKNKAIDGYHPETRGFHTKASKRLKAHKFEVMAFHGFLPGTIEGAHISIDRQGVLSDEAGFAPIKEREGVNTPERASQLFSEHDSSLLRERGWYIEDDASVELSPAFSFLDGRYLETKVDEGGLVGREAQLYLSGRNTRIGRGLNIKDNGQLIIRVNDEYNPEAEVKIGNNVEVDGDISFAIEGSGKLIVDDGVTFKGHKEYTIGDGKILHIRKDDLSLASGEDTRGKGSPLQLLKMLITLRDRGITEVLRKDLIEKYRAEFGERTIDREIRSLGLAGIIERQREKIGLAERYKDITLRDADRLNKSITEIIDRGLDRWTLDDEMGIKKMPEIKEALAAISPTILNFTDTKSVLSDATRGDQDAYREIKHRSVDELIAYFESRLPEITETLPEDLFGFGFGYDVRGNAQPVEEEEVNLTPENHYLIGKLLGSLYAETGDRILVTGDIREHTPILRYALALGYASVGVNADFSEEGLTTGAHNTYSAENPGNYKHQVQISGSHNPPAYNGIKIKVDFGEGMIEPLYATRLSRVYKERTNIRKGVDLAEVNEVSGIQDAVVEMYNETLPQFIKDEILVIDTRAGAAGPIAAEFFEKRGFKIVDMDEVREQGQDAVGVVRANWDEGNHKIVLMLNMHPDAKMRRGIWDPSEKEALVEAQKLVSLINGELLPGMPQAIGAVFDSDADRVTAIKEDGEAIPSFEMTLPYYQRFLLDPQNKAAITSIVQAGGEALMLACDVRSNNRLSELLDNINAMYQKDAGLYSRNFIEGWMINTGYPPQLDFVKWRIAQMDRFVTQNPVLSQDEKFLADYDHLKRTYFTAEASGHNYFQTAPNNPYRPCDDGLAAFTVLVNLRETIGEVEAPLLGMEEKDEYRLVELFEQFPTAFSSTDIRLLIPNNIKIPTAKKIGAWLKERYGQELNVDEIEEPMQVGDLLLQPKNDSFITVAGFKVQLRDGRSALVRWSNTRGQLTLMFTGYDWDSCIGIMQEVRDRISQEGVNVADFDAEISRLEDVRDSEREKLASTGEQLTADALVEGIVRGSRNIWQHVRNEKGESLADDIVQYLGWVTAPTESPIYNGFLNRVRTGKVDGLKLELLAEGITNVVVLGTGGSGLGIRTYGEIYEKDNLKVVDLESPQEIRNAMAWVEERGWDKTVFIVSSKSWGTTETRNAERIFRDEAAKRIGLDKVSHHFVAITDEGKIPEAKEANFRRLQDGTRAIFINNHVGDARRGLEIGGRFSSDSFFSLVPAELADIPHRELLKDANDEWQKLISQRGIYIGVQIGEILNDFRLQGKNKITFILDEELEPFGPWVQQLMNESLGKNEDSVVCVTGERFSENPFMYGNDRVFVRIGVGESEAVEVSEEKGLSIIDLKVGSKYDINRLQYRFKVATTVLANRMGVHPFNQPAVEDSKKITKVLLDPALQNTELTQKLNTKASENLKKEQDGLSIYYTGRTEESVNRVMDIGLDAASIEEILAAFLRTVKNEDYVYLSPYTYDSDELQDVFSDIRRLLRNQHSAHPATLFGIGSRCQHSDNQLNNATDQAAIIVFTFDESGPIDRVVPGRNYTLSQENMAHALGTVGALEEKNRRVIRVHLSREFRDNPEKIRDLFRHALEENSRTEAMVDIGSSHERLLLATKDILWGETSHPGHFRAIESKREMPEAWNYFKRNGTISDTKQLTNESRVDLGGRSIENLKAANNAMSMLYATYFNAGDISEASDGIILFHGDDVVDNQYGFTKAVERLGENRKAVVLARDEAQKVEILAIPSVYSNITENDFTVMTLEESGLEGFDFDRVMNEDGSGIEGVSHLRFVPLQDVLKYPEIKASKIAV